MVIEESAAVQLRRDVVDALAQAWHDRMLDRLVGIIRIREWGDLHEPTRAGYRTKVAWLATPVIRLMRQHPVVLMVGGPDITDSAHLPFAQLCGDGAGRFECTRVADHPADFHAAGDGDFVLAVWTARVR